MFVNFKLVSCHFCTFTIYFIMRVKEHGHGGVGGDSFTEYLANLQRRISVLHPTPSGKNREIKRKRKRVSKKITNILRRGYNHVDVIISQIYPPKLIPVHSFGETATFFVRCTGQRAVKSGWKAGNWRDTHPFIRLTNCKQGKIVRL